MRPRDLVAQWACPARRDPVPDGELRGRTGGLPCGRPPGALDGCVLRGGAGGPGVLLDVEERSTEPCEPCGTPVGSLGRLQQDGTTIRALAS